MKKRFAVFAAGILLSAALAVPAYANAPFESPTLQIVRDDEYTNFKEMYSFISDRTAKNSYGGLVFETNGGSGPLWEAEVLHPRSIIITEENAGALKEGKKLYFKVENLRFDKFLAVDLLEGDAVFDYEVNDDGWLELTILKASTTPTKLKIRQMAVVMGEHRKEATFETTKYAYSYPLVLVTDPAAPDNMFSAEENVLLAPHFAVQQEPWAEIDYIPFAYNRMTAGDMGFSFNGKKYPLSHPCFSRDGVLMVPLKECWEAVCAHNGMSLRVGWDAQEKTAFSVIEGGKMLFSISVERNTRTEWERETLPLQYPAELKDGTLYISFRDFIDIAVGENPFGKFYWNAKLKTASYQNRQFDDTAENL